MNCRNSRDWTIRLCAALALAVLASAAAAAGDWPRFRGPEGSGISPDTRPVPVKWSGTENLSWKLKLPGPGSSSPIVVGQRLYVTCWTGYGADRENIGQQKDLRRHLIAVDRQSGKIIWDRTIEPVLPEDEYSGMFTQHGYASHTPASDGRRVYVFFGKTGVLAFDLDGNKLWQTSVGKGSNPRRWGTASSPILYKDLVIVMASAESQSLVALNKDTGKEVWRMKDESFGNTWGTPVLVDCGQGRTDLVISVPGKIWGINPDDGKPRWWCEGLSSDSICASVIVHDRLVYALETGPRGGGTMAVRAGGEGDVTKTHVVWRGRERSRIATPLYDEGRIYWVSNRIASSIDAATGKQVYQTRIGGGPAPKEPAPGEGRKPDGAGKADGKRKADGERRPGGGFGGRGGGFGGRGGGFGGQDYSSPVLAGGKIYWLARSGEAFVYAPGAEFQLLAQNRLGDDGDFSATPAVSDGQLFIRSSKYLYCVAEPDK